MVIQVKALYLQKKILMEMFPLLVIDRVMMKVKEWETFSYIYKNNFNLDVKIIRPFNFYGDFMRYNDERIIPKFFYQSLNGKKITIYSDGKQTRSYCHIFDAVVMILHVIFKGKKFVYNIGNPKEEVNAEFLAKKILKITDKKKIKLKRIDYPSNYPSDEPKEGVHQLKTLQKNLLLNLRLI